MIDGQRVLGIIPARGGSKEVPRKNLREVGGRPLIAWTIVEARKSIYLDRLILSSDDEEIIGVARAWRCDTPFVRPAQLAEDSSPSVDAVLHALERLPGYEFVVLLQPTSPLRSVEDIDGCIQRCVSSGATSCVSVTACRENPRVMYRMDGGFKLQPFLADEQRLTRRQEYPRYYRLSGAVYVAQTRWLLASKKLVGEDTIGYEVPLERSLDIDTELDLVILDSVMRQGG